MNRLTKETPILLLFSLVFLITGICLLVFWDTPRYQNISGEEVFDSVQAYAEFKQVVEENGLSLLDVDNTVVPILINFEFRRISPNIVLPYGKTFVSYNGQNWSVPFFIIGLISLVLGLTSILGEKNER